MAASEYFTEYSHLLVKYELERQERKWGEQNHSQADWFVILGEEVGEVARAIFEKQTDNYREELIQVAAVCMAALENYDRK
jgi:NTP pyrophosphatase (non-canonical NTP hydrolase)